jgi:lysophospholipase L1-like esterase
MKKRVPITYVVALHLLLALVLLKSDFLARVQWKLNTLGKPQPAKETPEITPHFHRMLRYHSRMDGNVPEQAIVFIGDSIMQGLCVTAIGHPSVNYGIGSDTTAGVLQRLPEYESIARASVVVLAIGVNDMKRRPNADILRNISAIVERIPDTVPVIISALLPLNEEARQKRVPNWTGASLERINALNNDLSQLERSRGVLEFVNAGPDLVDETGNLSATLHDGDGVHLNAAGNAIWIEHLKEGIKRAQQAESTVPVKAAPSASSTVR